MVRQAFDRFQNGRAAGQQAGAGLVGFTLTAIPDAYWNFIPDLDPQSAGAYSSLGTVAAAFVVQRTHSAIDRRRMCRIVLKNPDPMFGALLDAGRDDLAGQMLQALQAYDAGIIKKRKLGQRLQEISVELLSSSTSSSVHELTAVSGS